MYLLIESSTERAMVAIVDEEKILFHVDLPFGYQHSRYLVPQIDLGLRQLNLTLRQMEAIAVGIGPGSFTGLRVGAMTAKALSFASSVPLVGVCTLHTFIPAQEAAYASIIDAKMGGAYLAIQGNHPEILPLDQLGGRLGDELLLVTPSAAQLQPKLARLYPDRAWVWEETAPNPLRMAALARHKFARGEYTLDGHIELSYMGKTQAEKAAIPEKKMQTG
ncbi:MAG: tRNA (adenosine(37)-N6)-threonylcarbamoyltransferase complex dimerization subunit type 1 TsaB [Parachlamydia sp.]|nr:tRNA (adenosine(37)-N6)-threonylcarbamoyltransferase complex dimerization subunit type 1 TsaB [Parachlamydia sp.]